MSQRVCLSSRLTRPFTSPTLHRRYFTRALRECAASRLGAAGGEAVLESTTPVPAVHDEQWFPDLEGTLKPLDGDAYDLVIAGAGPSGLAVASRVASAGYRVAIVAPDTLGIWVNNYGVWIDEFESMGLNDCFDTVWESATVWLNSEEERTLTRPYARVDRPKLKRKLLERCIQAGVQFHDAKVASCDNLTNDKSIVICSDGSRVTGTFVIDATGHSKALIKYNTAKYDPGYQGAYGITVTVKSHPFPVDKMLFMDWRDDHLDSDPELKESNSKLPTFLYAMPFSDTKVFLEETSLVARPIIPFPELKARLDARMKHLGLEVLSVEDEEYCCIPMGSILPNLPQRTIGVGGTAGMVHPSTGYMISRVLGAAPTVADALIDELAALGGRDKGDWTPEKAESVDMNAVSADVWAKIWPKSRVSQREFFNFGMEVLLKLDLAETREFFAAFFSLSDFHWQGFLSSRLTFLELIGFGLSLFANASNQARANLLIKGAPGLFVMLYTLATLDDVNAKNKTK